MRKGIMSLLPTGRAKRKSGNMQKAEEAAAKKEPEAKQQEQTAGMQDKPFVQTILVPKQVPATAVVKHKGRKMTLKRKR